MLALNPKGARSSSLRALTSALRASPRSLCGAGAKGFPGSLATASGSSGDRRDSSPSLLAVAAFVSDQAHCLPDRLGSRVPFLSRGLTLRAGLALTPPARVFSMEVIMPPQKRDPGRLLDTMEFRRMWAEGMKPAEIGATVGLAAKTVESLARKYGYSPRWRGRLRGSMPDYPAIDEPSRFKENTELAKPEPVEPKLANSAPVQTHPRWPVEYDAAIIKTGGKYSEIAALSKLIDRSINAIIGRWHQLRVM